MVATAKLKVADVFLQEQGSISCKLCQTLAPFQISIKIWHLEMLNFFTQNRCQKFWPGAQELSATYKKLIPGVVMWQELCIISPHGHAERDSNEGNWPSLEFENLIFYVFLCFGSVFWGFGSLLHYFGVFSLRPPPFRPSPHKFQAHDSIIR